MTAPENLGRKTYWDSIADKAFDVAIIGGGINGATAYYELCRRGYSVLLIDKKDFGGGTSQASAMMIWGGLLYLRNFDLFTVYKLSQARDSMVERMKEFINPCRFRYIQPNNGGMSRGLLLAALYFYWLLGRIRRKKPVSEDAFKEMGLIEDAFREKGSLLYEEAVLNIADCRFALQWILPFQSPSTVPLNYCALEGAGYNGRDKLWHMDLSDQIGQRNVTARAKLVINCGGIWADGINDTCRIRSPYKHVLSKGVFIGLARPEELSIPMIFEIKENKDVLSCIPWGPVSLWGPTETKVDDIDGALEVKPDDVSFLLDHACRCLKKKTAKKDIISLRCGIRPLAVKREYNGNDYTLDLSRKSCIVEDDARPWISVYGGKLTGCRDTARKIAVAAETITSPSGKERNIAVESREITPLVHFPGIDEPMPSPEWSAAKELCCTLEDYLRRRTNISQWVPREGLGFQNEYRDYLLALSQGISGENHVAARENVAAYEAKVKERFDRVLEHV